MPSDAPPPVDSESQATVPGAVSRTLTSRSVPPAASPVPGAHQKLAAAMAEPASGPLEDTLAEPPELSEAPAESPAAPVWVWAAVGAVVALGLGALLLI